MPAQFQTDNERRVLAWCQPGRCTLDALAEAVIADGDTAVDERQHVEDILKDLEARGLVTSEGDEWVQTEKAIEAFQTPTAA